MIHQCIKNYIQIIIWHVIYQIKEITPVLFEAGFFSYSFIFGCFLKLLKVLFKNYKNVFFYKF